MYEELNKRRAEWAGFKLQTVWASYVDLEKVLKWTYPDGSYFGEAPDFPNDIGACFKYFMPKLHDKKLDIRIDCDWSSTPTAEIYDDSNDNSWFGQAETPALAFCLAIDKLIDGGKIECGN